MRVYLPPSLTPKQAAAAVAGAVFERLRCRGCGARLAVIHLPGLDAWFSKQAAGLNHAEACAAREEAAA